MEMPSLFSLARKHAWETLSQQTALAFQRHSQSVSRDMLHGLPLWPSSLGREKWRPCVLRAANQEIMVKPLFSVGLMSLRHLQKTVLQRTRETSWSQILGPSASCLPKGGCIHAEAPSLQ